MGTGKEAILRAFLRALGDLDADGMIAAFGDGATWELPFAPGNLDKEHTGASALETFIRGIPGAFDYLEFTDPRIEETVSGRLVAELRGAGRVTSSGLPYRNRYIIVADFDDEDRIARLVEYYDPNALVSAFGGLDALMALNG